MRQWALSRLQLAMGEDVIGQVSQETTAEGIWYKLEELYLKKSLTNRLILLKSILTYRMKDGSNIKNHMTVFDDLVMRLKAADLKLEEELLAMILLLSLPERYTGFANSLIYGRDSITLSDVKTGILSEDLKSQIRGFSDDTSLGSSGSSHGLFVQRGFNGGESGRKGKNRGRSNSRKPSSRSKSKGKDKCNYCHEEGHWVRDCPKLKKKDNNDASSFAVNDEALCASSSSSTSGPRWAVDSGASFHMTSDRGCFSTFKEIDGSNILTANDTPCKVMGIGTVKFRMFDGIVRTVSDVRFVPSITKSLLSVGQFLRLGFKTSFLDDQARISRGTLVIAKGNIMPNNLFILQGQSIQGEACVGADTARELDATRLWHLRLGHTSERL